MRSAESAEAQQSVTRGIVVKRFLLQDALARQGETSGSKGGKKATISLQIRITLLNVAAGAEKVTEDEQNKNCRSCFSL
jgi:hypothetical protein